MLNDRVDIFPALQLSRRVVAVEGALAGVKARAGCLRVRSEVRKILLFRMNQS
jgi:hypothetical protein